MASITHSIIGREAVLAKFRARRDNVVARVQRTMHQLMARLAEYVRATKLSGQVLKNRTGTLRRSIHADAEADGNTVTGIVGTNVEYAHVHEDGGVFQIPGHQRTLTMVFGRPVAPRLVQVRAHSANFPQRAFLHPALAERRASIIEALKQSVSRTMSAPES